jgi:hypothetical protein
MLQLDGHPRYHGRRMRNRLFFRTLLLLALASAVLAQGGFDGPGWYQIMNVKSGKALSVDRDGSSVVQFPPSNLEFQVWRFDPANPGYFFIRNGLNGNTLEPTAGGNSSIVLAAPFRGTPSQQWRLETGKDGNALIINFYGKALDLPDGTSRDGVRMQIYDRNGDSNQRYFMRHVNGDWGGRWRGAEGRRDGDRRDGDRRDGDRRDDQRGYTVTCASDDGHRKMCEVDTRNGVRLTRQISGSPCRLNDSWGFNERGIWVDRGCRAEFQVGAR